MSHRGNFNETHLSLLGFQAAYHPLFLFVPSARLNSASHHAPSAHRAVAWRDDTDKKDEEGNPRTGSFGQLYLLGICLTSSDTQGSEDEGMTHGSSLVLLRKLVLLRNRTMVPRWLYSGNGPRRLALTSPARGIDCRQSNRIDRQAEASTDNPRDLSRTTDRTCTHTKVDVGCMRSTHTHTNTRRHTDTHRHARTHACMHAHTHKQETASCVCASPRSRASFTWSISPSRSRKGAPGHVEPCRGQSRTSEASPAAACGLMEFCAGARGASHWVVFVLWST